MNQRFQEITLDQIRQMPEQIVSNPMVLQLLAQKDHKNLGWVDKDTKDKPGIRTVGATVNKNAYYYSPKNNSLMKIDNSDVWMQYKSEEEKSNAAQQLGLNVGEVAAGERLYICGENADALANELPSSDSKEMNRLLNKKSNGTLTAEDLIQMGKYVTTAENLIYGTRNQAKDDDALKKFF